MLKRLAEGVELSAEFDVCVIGAGAAGITLATRLARRGRSVLLAEGGEIDFSAASQKQYEGAVVGDPYFDLAETRLRFLGGSTNHWGGDLQTVGMARFHAQDRQR